VTSKPHDALFKAAFASRVYASEFFRVLLPASLTSMIEWNTLRSEPASFIDSELADHHVDLLFSARIRDAGGVLYLLYLLLEHQSRNHPQMPYRLQRYVWCIGERHRTQSGHPLPLIIPVVVSHAPEGWTAPVHLHDLIVPPPASFAGVSELVPGFQILVDDLAHLSNEQLKARALSAPLKVALWTLRDARNGPRLLSNLEHWVQELEETLRTDFELMSCILRYVWNVCEDLHYAQFRATLRALLPEAERLAMTIAEELIQQGREEGRTEGRTEGQVSLLVKMLTFKFGDLSADHQARIESATPEQLELYAERLLSADTLDAVFADG
jgi:predicted transposase/invertase (TIGR01784 family)